MLATDMHFQLIGIKEHYALMEKNSRGLAWSQSWGPTTSQSPESRQIQLTKTLLGSYCFFSPD